MADLVKKLAGPRVLRFAIVGLSGVPVNLGMLWVFADHLGWPHWLSAAIAIEISIIWNFFLNDGWTFRDKKAAARVGFFRRMYRFNLVSLVGLGIQLGTALAMSAFFVSSFDLAEPGIWKYPAQLIGIGVAMSWNFLSNFYFTWAQKRPEPEPEAAEAAEVAEAAEPSTPPLAPEEG